MRNMFQEGCDCRCFCDNGKIAQRECQAPCAPGGEKCHYKGLIYSVDQKVEGCRVDPCNKCECTCAKGGLIKKVCEKEPCPPPYRENENTDIYMPKCL